MARSDTYGVLGVGAIGSAIVTGLCENADDAPKVLLSPRNAEIAHGLAGRLEQRGTFEHVGLGLPRVLDRLTQT